MTYERLKADGRLEPVAEKLKSAYQDYFPQGETMAERHPKTIFGKIFEGTIDYILFNQVTLSLVSVLEMPNITQVRSENFLPSRQFPSDHLRIEAIFEFKSDLPYSEPQPRSILTQST